MCVCYIDTCYIHMYNYVYICHIHAFMIFYGHLWYISMVYLQSPQIDQAQAAHTSRNLGLNKAGRQNGPRFFWGAKMLVEYIQI
jgi:hypothetical protein